MLSPKFRIFDQLPQPFADNDNLLSLDCYANLFDDIPASPAVATKPRTVENPSMWCFTESLSDLTDPESMRPSFKEDLDSGWGLQSPSSAVENLKPDHRRETSFLCKTSAILRQDCWNCRQNPSCVFFKPAASPNT